MTPLNKVRTRGSRQRSVKPMAEILESRRLLSATDFGILSTTPALARAGQDTIFVLGGALSFRYYGKDQFSAASIDWGDGTAITPADYQWNGFGIAAHHTYAMSGTYYATVFATVHGAGHDDFPISDVVRMDIESQVFVAVGQGPLYIRTGLSTADDTPVGIVTDSPPSSLHATIDWGDGSGPGPATLSPDMFFSHRRKLRVAIRL
jgi:hypothetical protein